MTEDKHYKKIKKQLETGLVFYFIVALMILAIVKY